MFIFTLYRIYLHTKAPKTALRTPNIDSVCTNAPKTVFRTPNMASVCTKAPKTTLRTPYCWSLYVHQVFFLRHLIFFF